MHNLYFRGKNKIKNKKVMKKMEKIIITRHKGAVDWIKKHYPKFSVFKHLTHASEEDIEGNIIVGTLPVNFIFRFPEHKEKRNKLIKMIKIYKKMAGEK